MAFTPVWYIESANWLFLVIDIRHNVLEFELGLSVDSAEVRGVLIYENQEVGDITFDFLA